MRNLEMRRIARFSRNGLLRTLRSAGVAAALASSAWRQRRLLILCYHGVSLLDEDEWDSALFVTPQFLRRRLEILRDGKYNVLELGNALQLLRSGTLPSKSVVLTFDDGFYNFSAAAVPVLEEFGFPATVYVSTYHCINQRPLLALTLRYLLWRGRAQVVNLGRFSTRVGAVDLRDANARALLANDLLIEARRLCADRANQLRWLGHIAKTLGIDWDQFLQQRLLHLMTPDEIASAAKRGFDIQLHTHRHRTPRDAAQFRFEVGENRRILESLTQRAAEHFCYPSGDHDPMFLPLLRDLGVKSATIGVARLTTAADEIMLLPRFVDTMAQSELVFESWLTGLASLLSPDGARLRRSIL